MPNSLARRGGQVPGIQSLARLHASKCPHQDEKRVRVNKYRYPECQRCDGADTSTKARQGSLPCWVLWSEIPWMQRRTDATSIRPCIPTGEEPAAPIQSQRSRVEASKPCVAVISATVCFLVRHEAGRAGPCPSMLMEQSCIVRCITSRRSLQQSMCGIQCTFCMLRGTQSHQPMGGLLFDFACATCPVALASPRTLPVVPCNPRAEPTKTPAAQATPNFPVGAVGQCLVRWRHHAASTDSGSETI
ncbi:hypothetical protein HDV62DRAFT_62546 [Trichoderma sp. SZMC 28011]